MKTDGALGGWDRPASCLGGRTPDGSPGNGRVLWKAGVGVGPTGLLAETADPTELERADEG